MKTENGTEITTPQAFVRIQLFCGNPEFAKTVADKYGIDYDAEVKEFIQVMFGLIDGPDIWMDGNLREAYDLVADKKSVLCSLSDNLKSMPREDIVFLLNKLPELYDFYRDKVLDVIVFGSNIAYFFPSITSIEIKPSDLIDYFNAHWQEKNIDPNLMGSNAWYIVSAFGQKPQLVFSEGEARRQLQLAILDQYGPSFFDSKDHLDKFGYLLEDLDPDVIAMSIERFMTKEEFVAAADLAKRFEMKDAFELAVRSAYNRCFDLGQLHEAAILAQEYDHPDWRQAGLKEMEKLKSQVLVSLKEEDKKIALDWALKFGYSLSKEYLPKCISAEDSIKVGCLDLAQYIILHRYANVISYSRLLDMFLYPGNPYFTEDESVKIIADKMIAFHLKLKPEENSHIGTKRTWNNDMIEWILVNWIMLANNEKSKIEAFAERYLAGSCDLDILARKAAELTLAKGAWSDWREYKTICQEWLPKQYAEALEIENIQS